MKARGTPEPAASGPAPASLPSLPRGVPERLTAPARRSSGRSDAGHRQRRAAARQPAKSVSLASCDAFGRDGARRGPGHHQNRLNCSRPAARASRAGEGSSVRPPGDQPSATMNGRTLAIERHSRPTSSSRSRASGACRDARDDLHAEARHAQQASRSARLTSTGKAPRLRNAQASFGSIARSSMPSRAGQDLAAARSRRSASASRPDRADARASAAASSAAAPWTSRGSG